MNPSDLVLALDIGTSSLKSALFDPQGKRLAATTAQEAYSLRVAADGAAELAVRDLEQAALRALKKTLAAKRRDASLKNRRIAAVGASCFWHSLLGYDAKRQQPTPIYTWADARCEPDADRWRTRLDEKKYHARTGCMLRAPYWPAKLRWLRRTKQATGITSWMSPADWLYGRLCGSFASTISMASGTGLMNAPSGGWDADLLRFFRIRETTLPMISDGPLHVTPCSQGQLPPLHRFPELRDALWFPALGDGAAGNLGSDALSPNVAALNVGTSGAIRLARKGIPRRLSSGLFCYRVDEDHCLIGGAVSNAGNLRNWALRELRLPDDSQALEKALAARPLPRHGLTVLPFWTKERAPSWPDAKTGTVQGMTYATTALDLLQAITESTYHRLAQVAEELEKQNGSRSLDIVASGGIRKSPESLQRLANVFNRPIRACVEPEASLRGAALHVCERLGHSVSPLRRGRTFSPNRVAAKMYAKYRAAQIALEQKLQDQRSP